MLGPARISDGEFLRLVGRSDLGNRHSVAIAVTRSLGFTAIGMGLTVSSSPPSRPGGSRETART